ncbi:MAG: hypothetical protein ILA52_02810 [Alphaproteobacteria bacterium]|nr:hypothetical protein [Alphaproteobacteria bacterium]MBP1532409.1 hypothetical protein [Alphaproteobacteria bacterium]
MGFWNNIKNNFKDMDVYAKNNALFTGAAISWGAMAALCTASVVVSGGALTSALVSGIAMTGSALAASAANKAQAVNKKAETIASGKNVQDNSKLSFREKWKKFDRADKFKVAMYTAGAACLAVGTVAMGGMSAPLFTISAYVAGAIGMGQAATYAIDIAENNTKIKAAEKAGRAGLAKQKENSKTRTRENTNHITMEPQLHTSDDVRKKIPQDGKETAVSQVKINTNAFNFTNLQNQGDDRSF